MIPDDMSQEADNVSLDDPEVIEAVNGFLADMEQGKSVDRQTLIRRFPGIANELAACLDGLDMLYRVAPQLQEPGEDAADSSRPIQATATLGDFRIVREIGRGGMGVVYEAEQLSLGRRVALKVLPFAAMLDQRQLQRFKNEAQAAALLHHQNIVPVHGIGCARGVHYYAMQFIDGHTAAEVIRDLRRLEGLDEQIEAATEAASPNSGSGQSLAAGRIDPHGRRPGRNKQAATDSPQTADPERPASDTVEEFQAVLSTERSSKRPAYFRSIAELGIQVAEALEHAHGEGVVHRDIKPSNLILDPAGKIWVTDFGLAQMESDHGVTVTGDLIGTLRYMSPEQALAKRVVIDHRTDIYSLGVTLYELLTLRLAYPDEDRQELIRKIAFEEPKPPRRWNKFVPVELETIVLKAMAKSPPERFASAKELAEDLRRFLDDKPIQAKRATLAQRITKWSRRHRSVVTAAAVVLVMAVAGLALSNLLIARQRNAAQANYQKAENSRQQAVTNFERAERQRLRAEKSDEQGRQRLVRLMVANGMHHLDEGELLSSLPWFTEALRLDHADPERTRLHRIRIRSALSQCPKLAWMWYHEGPVTFETGTLELKLSTNAEFSPDGRFVVAPSGKLAENTWTARVWDTTTGQVVHVLTHSIPVLHATFSGDGRMIATASGDLGGGYEGFASVWDADTGKQITPPLVHGNAVFRASFSPDGSRLVTGSLDKTARVWNVRTGVPVTPPMEHDAQVNAVTFSPDGRRVLTASDDWTIWDSATGQALKKLSTDGSLGVFHVSFSPDGSRVVTAGKTAQIWETDSGRLLATLPHANNVWHATFSPDGRWVVTSSSDMTAQVWDAVTGRRVGAPMSHLSGVTQTQFSPDSRLVVTASWGRRARVWEVSTGRPITLPLKHGGDVMCAAFSPDGHRIVTASTDRLVRIWDLSNLRGISRSIRHSDLGDDEAFTAAFSPDGRSVVTAGADQSARVWDASTREPITPSLKHEGAVRHAAFSPDSQLVLTTSDDGTARIWDAATGQPRGAPLKHDSAVTHGSFSPDGGRVVTASDDAARCWNVLTGKPTVTLQHRGRVRVACFSPDGDRVLTCSHDTTARVWEAATAQPVTPPLKHDSTVEFSCFSGDGLRVLTTSNDGTARVWDASTGEPLGPPLWHGQSIWRGAFSPDGLRVATASNDNTVQVWDAVTGEPLMPPLGWQPSNPYEVSFSPDGRLIATAWQSGFAIVWDAITGEPLTGRLRHGYQHVVRAEFSPDGRRLLTASDEGTARLWDLLPDQRPIEDLVLLAQVLCGHRIDATGASLVPVEPRALRDAWQSLRDKYPADFLPTPKDLFAWHREEADQCEKLQRWNEAIKHVETARQYNSDPSNFSRLDETLARLKLLRTKAEEMRVGQPTR